MKSLLAPLALAAALACVAPQADAAVTMRFVPSAATVNVGQTIAFDLLADIDEPVIGFDFEVMFDPLLATLTDVTFGSAWDPFSMAIGAELIGLAPFDPTLGQQTVNGDDVLLATLSFSGNAPGITALNVSFSGVQGFYLEPDPNGTDPFPRVQDVTTQAGALQVVPEPATLALLLPAVFGAGWLSRRRQTGRG